MHLRRGRCGPSDGAVGAAPTPEPRQRARRTLPIACSARVQLCLPPPPPAELHSDPRGIHMPASPTCIRRPQSSPAAGRPRPRIHATPAACQLDAHACGPYGRRTPAERACTAVSLAAGMHAPWSACMCQYVWWCGCLQLPPLGRSLGCETRRTAATGSHFCTPMPSGSIHPPAQICETVRFPGRPHSVCIERKGTRAGVGGIDVHGALAMHAPWQPRRLTIGMLRPHDVAARASYAPATHSRQRLQDNALDRSSVRVCILFCKSGGCCTRQCPARRDATPAQHAAAHTAGCSPHPGSGSTRACLPQGAAHGRCSLQKPAGYARCSSHPSRAVLGGQTLPDVTIYSFLGLCVASPTSQFRAPAQPCSKSIDVGNSGERRVDAQHAVARCGCGALAGQGSWVPVASTDTGRWSLAESSVNVLAAGARRRFAAAQLGQVCWCCDMLCMLWVCCPYRGSRAPCRNPRP